MVGTFLLTFVGLLAGTTVQGICPAGWQHNNESCYHFVNKERSWNDAQVDCVRHGSRLVIIDTHEENEYLRGYLQSNRRLFYGFDLWLGGKKTPGGVWHWSDGTLLAQDQFTDWHTDSGQEDPHQVDVCMEFESDADNNWSTDFCDDLNFHICERPFNPLTPPPPPVG